MSVGRRSGCQSKERHVAASQHALRKLFSKHHVGNCEASPSASGIHIEPAWRRTSTGARIWHTYFAKSFISHLQHLLLKKLQLKPSDTSLQGGSSCATTSPRINFGDVQLSGMATSQNQLLFAQHVQELQHTISVSPGFWSSNLSR